MSDPKRATIITVGAPKSVKNKVNKTVRLAINLDESNESKYPELNYKELVIAAAKKKRIENGKTAGLDPFSDNDDDVERVARKFEQKYGGKSTYGRKGRSKYEEFADIGAGYDENDSFIDNTHGYDEMIPPECDTLYGGFYINSGSLEFKTVPENQTPNSDGDVRRNKRRLSSSSSEEESSDSSTNSDSQDVKENKTVPNGNTDSHKTEHRKKKVKNNEKKKSNVSQSDTTAPTSGKQTSDEACPEGSSTSLSDSLTSKPAPSSENLITSDSSRETEAKFEVKLPQIVSDALERVQLVSREKDNPGKDLKSKTDQCILRLEQSLNKSGASSRVRREAWSAAGGLLGCSRAALLQRTRKLSGQASNQSQSNPAQPITTPAPTPAPTPASAPAPAPAPVTVSRVSVPVKRKAEDRILTEDFSRLSPDEKEAEIVETLRRLKALIDERKPDMIATYNAECERVQEERKKLQIASADGMPHVDKRLPKRRFPWCPLSRALLARLGRVAGSPADAASLLAKRALPLFPAGFVRMPTLLRQADLNKDIKATDLKRQAFGSTSQPQPVQTFSEPIQFPSSLTVTTTTKPIEKPEKDRKAVGPQVNDKKESSTVKKKEALIRVKSPAALNDMVKKDEVTQKQIESMKTAESNIPHPILIPVNFAKPDKRPPEKKKKEVLIVSDVDPLAEARDDSSSDIEVIEDKVTEEKCSVSESDKVPSDKVKGVEFTKQEFELLMKDLQEMENSQEQKKVNFNSFGGVITNAKNESSKQFNGTVFDSENKNKFAERTSFKEIDGCNTVNG